MNCYKFISFKKFCSLKNYKFINYENNNKIEQTFILTLDNANLRHKHIYQQIIKNKLPNVTIVINKPFTKCKKNNKIKNPLNDILYSNMIIYKYAIKKNYQYILVLEDDFKFIKIPNYRYINTLIKKIQPDILYLGHLPFFILNNYKDYQRVISIYGHSYIVSQKAMKKLISDKKIIRKYNCLDEILAVKSFNLSLKCYAIKPQICFQKDFRIKRSSNSNRWDNFISNLDKKYITNTWEPRINIISLFVKYLALFLIILSIYKLLKKK